MSTQLRRVKPLTLDDRVVATPYEPGEGLPLFIQPRDPALRDDPAAARDWFQSNAEVFDAMLAEAGALVFRGFPVHDTAAFGALVDHYESPKFGYTGGSSPREQLAARVYESTHAPAEDVLQMHQEMAYLPTFPRQIAFWCRMPAVSGGETFLADMRRVTAELPPEFVRSVEKLGVNYNRNFRDLNASTGSSYLDTIHRSWQQAFSTVDREKPLRDCEAMGLKARWLEDGSLATDTLTPGMITHPATGERVWFNQLATNTICPQSIHHRYPMYEAYYGTTKPRPYVTTYGDLSPIPQVYLDALYDTLKRRTVAFPWSSGDVLLIDNYFTSHGRNRYTGLRDVQVALFS
jgi:alpha-ketoglutarate-dependent taurine dioxygenase